MSSASIWAGPRPTWPSSKAPSAGRTKPGGAQSAGAAPGPACYGRGEWPTVTDANLFLGRLDPDFFLGGRMKIHPERSLEAIRRLAQTIRKPVLEPAQGMGGM